MGLTHIVARISDVVAGAAFVGAFAFSNQGGWVKTAVFLVCGLVGLGCATDAHMDTDRRTT